jgi:glycosyltransferase involved in cell wall biosynthesis
MMPDIKTWIVTEYYYPTIISTGYYITEIAEYLAIKNNNIHVICTNSNYNNTINQATEKEDVVNNVHIHRVFIGNISKNVFILRAIKLFWSSLKLFLKLICKVRSGDKVLVVTNPAFLFLLLPIIKKIRKIQYNILIHDIFPENLVAIGKIRKTSILYKTLKILFDHAYSQAETCIAIGRDMIEVIKSKLRNRSKIILITNWADVEEVFPVEKEKTKMINHLNLANKFVYQFAGNLGHAQGLDNILEAIKMIDNSNLHFLFIGAGAKEETIRDYIKNNSKGNVTLVGFQSRNDQNDFLNACDIAIVTLNEGMFGLGVPSKAYNIMASGKPIIIIADKNSEISLCVKEFNLGWVVEPNSPNTLKDIFCKVYEDAVSNKTMTTNSRQIAENYFAKNIILNKYSELLS